MVSVQFFPDDRADMTNKVRGIGDLEEGIAVSLESGYPDAVEQERSRFVGEQAGRKSDGFDILFGEKREDWLENLDGQVGQMCKFEAQRIEFLRHDISLVLRCVRISGQVVRLGRREGFEVGLHTCDIT